MSVTSEMAALCRRSGAESAVLLKNEGGILPLEPGKPVAVFGVGQLLWMDMGYGSGGDVVKPYSVNLLEGIEAAGGLVDQPLADFYRAWCESQPHGPWPWGMWPLHHPEPELSQALAADSRSRCDTALVVIGRSVGESMDLKREPGSYLLAEDERRLLDLVTAQYDRVVVLLNIGNLIDLGWTGESRFPAVLALWQGGMESGNAAADLLYGRVNPCGKLADTVARRYEDYPSAGNFGADEETRYEEDIYLGYRWFSTFGPDQPLYPFGFGLSYTSFRIDEVTQTGLTVTARVTNTGSRPGREVLELYCAAPQGLLGKPGLSLCAFGKTGLLAPGQAETLTLITEEYLLASYDDGGKTGYLNAWVLEAGDYRLLLGASSHALTQAGVYSVAATKLVRQCAEACAPAPGLRRLTASGDYEPAPARRTDLRQRILASLPAELPVTGDRGIRFADVKAGKASLSDFTAQLTDEELEALTRGEGAMDSDFAAPGNAGGFGGVLPSLREKGVPPVITTDGPSGVRVKAESSLLPCAAALACCWDPALVEALYRELGKEVLARGSDVQLGPGLNLHRNPLCGRNFEYYSEDPLLTGRLAAAAVRGIQAAGVSACPKHFACNNQEHMRNHNDSRVSQRALRELYLRGFELCVRESAPRNLMTSYNRLNGVWNHYNYELMQVILRGEWGYQGCVMTDWWLTPAESPEFPGLRVHAYRVRAGVDVFMPGNHQFGEKAYRSDGSLWETLEQPEGITRGEAQQAAMHTLRFLLTRLGGPQPKVTLRPIGQDNFIPCFHLQLGPGQDRFVSTPIRSLAQAYVYRDQCTPFGVYAGETMVGYLLVLFDPEEVTYNLWHVMIDAAQQGRGYGRAACLAAIDYMKTRPLGASDRVLITCDPKNTAAWRLYESLGFRETGREDEEERELALPL